MTDNHPITPSQYLVEQWWKTMPACSTAEFLMGLATQGARWGADQQLKLDGEQISQAWQKGADQELEACIGWLALNGYGEAAGRLRAARRPKPLSVKERIAAAITDGDERTALSLLNEALPE